MSRAIVNIGSALGGFALTVTLLGALLAPIVAPHEPDARFEGILKAPPTAVHIVGGNGRMRSPFIHPWVRVNQLEQRYESDQAAEVELTWLAGGHLVQSADEARTPFLLLGSDSYGRDVFSRLLFGARVSLGLSMAAALLAMCLGAMLGGLRIRWWGDRHRLDAHDRVSDRPSAIRGARAASAHAAGASSATCFDHARNLWFSARLASQRCQSIIGSGITSTMPPQPRHSAQPYRLLVRHLLPSARGFLVVQLTLLIPAFIVAEATLSFVGLGFPDPVPSWGTMLHEASNLRALADFPWLLSPAAAMFLVVFSVNLLLQRGSTTAFDSTGFRSIRS
jgi:peptide/nickel transport system permease protein